ncbi:hypothetical protein HanPI659440_Chr11g0428821 [Helianthus annuus]|nr:hypothetical protein HanPI659440_Chr11g0428821 [Helianthus annuus]
MATPVAGSTTMVIFSGPESILCCGVGYVVSRCCSGCDAGDCAVGSSNEKIGFFMLVVKSTDYMFVDLFGI